jgi:hypothetical protein
MLKKKTPGMTQGRPSGFQCIDAYVYIVLYTYLIYRCVYIYIHIYIYVYMHFSYYVLMSVQKKSRTISFGTPLPFPMPGIPRVPENLIVHHHVPYEKIATLCVVLSIFGYIQFPDTQKYRAYHSKNG